MQTIERGGYSREEILSVLHSENSARQVRFRYDLLDKDELFKKTLDSVISGEVSMSALSTIKRTAKFTIKEITIPAHIGRELRHYESTWDDDFSGWSGAGSVVLQGVVKMSSPASSLAPSSTMESFGGNEAGIATGWKNWGGTNGTYGATGIALSGSSAQSMTKTSSSSASFGIQTANMTTMSVTAGDTIYLSFFYRKDASLPQPAYLFALANDGKGNFNFSTSGTVTYTDLGNNGWWRCDAQVVAPRTTQVGILIGVSTSATGQLIIDNVYLQKNVAPIWNCEAVSVVVDYSDDLYLGGDYARYHDSMVDYTKHFGQYNSSYANPPANMLWYRYSTDGGYSWSNWLPQYEEPLSDMDETVNTSELRLQFKWTAERYVCDDYVALEMLHIDFNYTRDLYVPEDTEINYLTDRIQPFMEVRMPDGNWIEFPLGVFLLSTPTRHDETNGIYRDIEAYDGLIILDDDKFISRYYIPAGTKYTDAIVDILKSAGIRKYNITDKADTVKSDIEFAMGTSKLEAVNTLLEAINYTSLWVDANGVFRASPYIPPSDRAEEYWYEDDELSVIYNGIEEELDVFGVPNIWVVTQSNPEKTPLVSTVINNNPDSPTSTVNIGRNIVDFREVEDISDQATLDAYARRIAVEASQVYGTLKFKTHLMPFHEYADVFWVKYGALRINDKFSETAWKMELKVGGEMEHEVRKVVNI